MLLTGFVPSLALAAAATILLGVGAAVEPIPTTMKAIRAHQHGNPDVLRHEDVAVPKPGAGELLVRVHAAGVNPVDWKVVRGGLRDIAPPLPLTTGFDISGVVVAVSDGTDRFKPGDEIYVYQSLSRGGAYAEYALVAADDAARKPATLSHLEAAAVPLAALTAWQALFEHADLQPGQTVLIHGAAGGVGHFAVQLAKTKGARVIGTASALNHDFLRSLGADEVIDYRTTRFEDAVRDVDVVLDCVGSETLDRSYAVVKRGGIVVTIAGRPSPEAAAARGARVVSFLVRPDAAQLDTLRELITEGKLKPTVSEVLPLAEARRAHELSQSGRTRGKIVLRVHED